MQSTKTLKADLWFHLDEGIELMIVSINGDQVRIGVRAPREVKVYRAEISDQFQSDSKEDKTSPKETLEGLQTDVEMDVV